MQFRNLTILALAPLGFARAFPDDQAAPAAPASQAAPAGQAAPAPQDGQTGPPPGSAPDGSQLPKLSPEQEAEETENAHEAVRLMVHDCSSTKEKWASCTACWHTMSLSFGGETMQSLDAMLTPTPGQPPNPQIEPMMDDLSKRAECTGMMAQLKVNVQNLHSSMPDMGQMGAAPGGAPGQPTPPPPGTGPATNPGDN